MSDRFRIGVDLGGTKTEVLLLDPTGQEKLRRRLPTPRDQGYAAILKTIALLIQEAGRLADGPYTVGMGIPGILDPGSGRVINANTTVLIGNPLRDDLANLIGRPLHIENDANCFALAEGRMGAGRGFKTVFGVILGTGCGGGIYLNGSIHSGRHGIAGEWGHFSIDPEGPLCWCGNRGCVETLISGSGLEKRFEASTGRHLTVPEILAEARLGKTESAELFDQFLDDFGRALGGLISILDPDAVVLGGGLSNIDELYTEGRERIKRYVFHPDLDTPVLRNLLGDSAGVFGAAWIGV